MLGCFPPISQQGHRHSLAPIFSLDVVSEILSTLVGWNCQAPHLHDKWSLQPMRKSIGRSGTTAAVTSSIHPVHTSPQLQGRMKHHHAHIVAVLLSFHLPQSTRSALATDMWWPVSTSTWTGWPSRVPDIRLLVARSELTPLAQHHRLNICFCTRGLLLRAEGCNVIPFLTVDVLQLSFVVSLAPEGAPSKSSCTCCPFLRSALFWETVWVSGLPHLWRAVTQTALQDSQSVLLLYEPGHSYLPNLQLPWPWQ